MSKDSEERHASFRDSLSLPFPLLSDADSEIARAYGVKRMGPLPSKRATFVIAPDGTIERAISAELNIAEHAREALAAVRGIA